MKLIITHPHKFYDRDSEAKEGIEELIEKFDSQDIFELDDEDELSYAVHEGKIFPSFGGEIRREYRKEIKERLKKECKKRKEEEFILTGGYFGQCHSNTFLDLHKKFKARNFIFPLESIYFSKKELFARENYFDITMDRYSPKSTIYLDGELLQKGKKCTIHFFSTNEKLLSYIS